MCSNICSILCRKTLQSLILQIKHWVNHENLFDDRSLSKVCHQPLTADSGHGTVLKLPVYMCLQNSDGFLKPGHHSTCTHVRRSGTGVDALLESLSAVGAGSWLFARDVSFVSVPHRLPVRPGGNLRTRLARNMFIYLNDHCSPKVSRVPNVAPVVATILHYSLRDISLRANAF